MATVELVSQSLCYLPPPKLPPHENARARPRPAAGDIVPRTMLRALVLAKTAVVFAAATQPQQCLFSGASLRNHSGAPVECSQFAGRQVALYFAGEWCPLCRFEATDSNNGVVVAFAS